ncbi:MAG: hypothetical protein IPG12_10635 [Saprospiraceae bacterium]|nr:hypothetical protein [Saprospiraceae bacterium]
MSRTTAQYIVELLKTWLIASTKLLTLLLSFCFKIVGTVLLKIGDAIQKITMR